MSTGALNILHFAFYQDGSDGQEEEPRLILAPQDGTNARRSWFRGGRQKVNIDQGGRAIACDMRDGGR